MTFDFIPGDARRHIITSKVCGRESLTAGWLFFVDEKFVASKRRGYCAAEHKASAFRTLKRLGLSLPSQLYQEVRNFVCETTIREQCFMPLS